MCMNSGAGAMYVPIAQIMRTRARTLLPGLRANFLKEASSAGCVEATVSGGQVAHDEVQEEMARPMHSFTPHWRG